MKTPAFRGKPRSRQIHPDDFESVIARAAKAQVVGQMLTGDCLSGSKDIIDLAKANPSFRTTAGCHPCRAKESMALPGGLAPYFAEVEKLVTENKGIVVSLRFVLDSQRS